MITLRIYFNWFLINVLFCLVPIFVSILIIGGIDASIISSIIAYCFTILIASIYIFDRVSTIESSLKWSSIFVTFILLGTYVYYPNLASKNQTLWFESNKVLIVFCILVATLILSFIMNLPSMQGLIEEISEKEKFDKAKKTGEQVDDLMSQLQNRK